MAGLSQKNPLKAVFNPRNITAFAERLRTVWPVFGYDEFLNRVLGSLDPLGFLERSKLITAALAECLPKDFPQAASILVSALGPELGNPGETEWDSFVVMPQCGYIAAYGRDYVDLSLEALREMTKRFSAEGDLRSFIEADYEKTMAYLHRWCDDPSPHVRRLVSEGTRPRLPLAGRIRRFQQDPRPLFALLDRLWQDDSLYVRRSVANNINDIAKDHPDLAVEVLEGWASRADERGAWVVRHAARSLTKRGNARALALFGFEGDPGLRVDNAGQSVQSLKTGEDCIFSCDLVSVDGCDRKLMVDYVVHFVKAKDKVREKVFKHRKILLREGSSERIRIKHRFADTSGRTHYPGTHKVELQINGKRYGGWTVELI